MTINKQIERDNWIEFFGLLSNGNKGRKVAIEIVGMDIGDETLADGAPLFAIDYDPIGKGNDIVVSLGSAVVDHTHTINAPTEVWQAQDDAGVVTALEIVDQNGQKSILSF